VSADEQLGGESALSGLVAIATEWAEGNTLPRSMFAQAVSEVGLPARLYRSALGVLEAAGIRIVDDVDEAGDVDADAAPGRGGVDGFGHFMRQTAHRVLTAEEEQAIGKRMDEGRLAQALLDERRDLPPGMLAQLRRKVRDGQRATDELASHNIRLVISLAKRVSGHVSPGHGFEDLVQEGYFGLARAIEKWDHTRGLKFSTYATWWIRQTMDRSIGNLSTVVRLPIHARDDLRRILRAERELTSTGRTRRVTAAQLAELTGLEVSKVRELLAWRDRIDTLDRIVGSGDATLGDFVSARGLDPQREAEAEDVGRRVRCEMTDALTEREATILGLRFGFDGEPQTLEQIGRSYGVTRERIRQIEAKAIKKLRHPVRLRSLQPLIRDED
jgi:RNA polymerase primary sigma factor